MPTSIPAMVTVIGAKPRRAPSAMTISAASPPPTTATGPGPRASIFGQSSVAQTSASCAPEATPRVVGSASGLRSTACIKAPDSPRSAPISRAMTARGINPKAKRICSGDRSCGPAIGSTQYAAGRAASAAMVHRHAAPRAATRGSVKKGGRIMRLPAPSQDGTQNAARKARRQRASDRADTTRDPPARAAARTKARFGQSRAVQTPAKRPR